MAEDEPPEPSVPHDFDDLIDELGGNSSFVWDQEELESQPEDVTRPVVTFRIGDDRFAIPGKAVREIVGSTEMTQLPGTPPHIRGITVVRRQVVGLLSLRTFLEIGEDPSEPSNADESTERTLIVETAHYTVGLIVDEVTGLDEWPDSLIDPDTVPDNLRLSTRRYARGARTQDGGLCIYLDLEPLLDAAAVQ